MIRRDAVVARGQGTVTYLISTAGCPTLEYLGIGIDEQTPDHSTISRTRRLIDVETHHKVFFWILEVLRDQGMVKGKTVGIDATTLEASAAMRSIVRRHTGESYEGFLKRLVQESGIETPTKEDLARLDRKRKNKASNEDWVNPHDRDARTTKMKDGRTHLAHKSQARRGDEDGSGVGGDRTGCRFGRHHHEGRDSSAGR